MISRLIPSAPKISQNKIVDTSKKQDEKLSFERNPIQIKAWLFGRIEELGLTQRAFLLVSGVNRADLNDYINGNQSPSIEVLSRLASALDIGVIELLIEFGFLDLEMKYFSH